MNGCFIGPVPGFETSNVYSETPFIAILETEGRSTDNPDGSKSIEGSEWLLYSFSSIAEAYEFEGRNESPDNVTTVNIYAFAMGEWRLVKPVAKPL